MKKAKYLFGRIISMNYGKFFKYINKIHRRNGKNRILIIIDVIYCGLVHQSGYTDYDLFRMDEMSSKERKTILTRGRNNVFIKYFNNPQYFNLFYEKNLFNEKFKDFLGRDWMLLDDNYDEFRELIKDKDYIMGKPINGTHGDGIEKIKIAEYSPEELYNYLLKKKLLLIEEVIEQNETMNELYPDAINTIRMITLAHEDKATILAAYLRIGNGGRHVDNFNSGGMVAPIDVKTGAIKFPALDKPGNLYEIHPQTGTKIVGFEIPSWNDILKFSKDLALVCNEVGMVGWDIGLTPKGPVIVEGNEYPGHDIYQLPPHRDGNIGVLPDFEKVLKEMGLTYKDIQKPKF